MVKLNGCIFWLKMRAYWKKIILFGTKSALILKKNLIANLLTIINVWKEYDICHYWYFLDKGVRFQAYVCNGCHDVLMISMKLRNIAILKTYGVKYCCIITGISKNEAINLLQKADLKEKTRTL